MGLRWGIVLYDATSGADILRDGAWRVRSVGKGYWGFLTAAQGRVVPLRYSVARCAGGIDLRFEIRDLRVPGASECCTRSGMCSEL